MTSKRAKAKQEDRAAELLGRTGITVRAALYLLVGALAGRMAAGDRTEHASKEGAVAALVRQPMGRLLVLLLGLGFVALAGWRFAEAWVARRRKTDAPNVAKQFLQVWRGAIALGIAAGCVPYLRSGERKHPKDDVPDITAKVLGWPGGRVLVAVIGIGLLATGVAMGIKAVRSRFAGHLDTADVGKGTRRTLEALGRLGEVGRMVVFALIGVFLVRAALDHQGSEAAGIDTALRRVVAHPWGTWVLAGVAVALVAYGLYLLAEARWRAIPDPKKK